MELLLAAVKDAATGRSVAADTAQVEALIDRLRIGGGGGGGSPSPTRQTRSPSLSPRGDGHTVTSVSALAPPPPPAASSGAGARALELDLLRRKLEEDNNRLKGELLAAKRMLTDRLKV